MSILSRRTFLGSTVGSVALPAAIAVAAAGPGGTVSPRSAAACAIHSRRPHIAASDVCDVRGPLFGDVDPVVLPHPNAFDSVVGANAPDVIVTNDWITGQWPERDRLNMVKHLDAGKGLVVLHHAVGTNNDAWAWWSEEVIGCYLYNANVPGMKTQARLKQFVRQTITPVGTHPIVRGLEPFKLPWDETFPNMWISPRSTVLLESDDPSFNNPAVGWVGPHQKARVACLQPGHTRHVCQDPNYRDVVHRMVLWAGGRLS